MPEISSSARAFINHLRFVALECRTKPRTGLFEACALIRPGRVAAQEAHSEVLMRCLREALGKPSQLHRPGTPALTFDEHWLIQLGIACSRGDLNSRRFLLGSRVAFENRRLVGYLVEEIASVFAL